jgi:hypothetical protein
MQHQKRVIVLSIALAITLVFLVYFIIMTEHFSYLYSQGNLDVLDKASSYDSNIHDLLQEHTFLLVDLARRSLTSSASVNDSYNALQINLNEIAAQISAVYGPQVANKFLSLWRFKINSFISYANALKNRDPTADSVFEADMSNYEEESSAFWSDLIPSLTKSQMQQLVTQHVDNMKSTIDYWNTEDYPDYFSKLHDSYTQMGIYADTIAQAIINQNPNYFR